MYPDRRNGASGLLNNSLRWRDENSYWRYQSTIRGLSKASDQLGIFHPSRAPYRFVLLFFASLISFSGYFLYDNIGALEENIESELHISEDRFALLYSVYSFPNMVLPFIGGIALDRYLGTRMGSMVTMGIAMVGTFLVSIALRLSAAAYYVMLIGRFLFGLGTETSYGEPTLSEIVAQNTILCDWFTNKELALAMGLSVSAGRLGSFFTFNVNVFIANRAGTEVALLVGAIISAVSFMGVVLYVLMDRYAEKKGVVVSSANAGDPPRLSAILHFPLDFWLLCILTTLYYSAVFPFQSLGQTLLMERYGYSDTKASRLISVLPFTSLILSPIFGIVIDRIAWRAVLATLGILVMFPSFLVLAATYITPIPSIVAIGIAYSLVPSAIWPCVPLMIDERSMGTAFGFLSALINISLVVMYYVQGAINKYLDTRTQVIVFAIVTIAGCVVGVFWNVVDARKGYLVNKPNKPAPPSS